MNSMQPNVVSSYLINFHVHLKTIFCSSQHIFSMYVMGSTDPAYLGEDYESVRRYSQALIKLIQETQPHGPYFIGGYSFGGLCALEIASQLSEVGEHVELVVMIDTVRWIPQGRNNSQMLLEKYKEDITVEEHIQVSKSCCLISLC